MGHAAPNQLQAFVSPKSQARSHYSFPKRPRTPADREEATGSGNRENEKTKKVVLTGVGQIPKFANVTLQATNYSGL